MVTYDCGRRSLALIISTLFKIEIKEKNVFKVVMYNYCLFEIITNIIEYYEILHPDLSLSRFPFSYALMWSDDIILV